MKKWKCTVCGYVHEGDGPPTECPKCKAPAEKFAEVTEEAKAKRVKCTVCGYIEDAEAPPQKCPICHAAVDKFVGLDAEGNELPVVGKTEAAAPAAKPAEKQRPGFMARLVLRLHIHPITAHIPNGILPVALIFLAISIFFGIGVFEAAAYYNLVAVLVTMPLVLLTGIMEWKNRYKGAKTFIFFTKIFCAAVVTTTLIILVVWRFAEPGVASADSPYRMIYLGIAVVMIAATAIAGHIGGKLVFGSRKN